MEIGEKIKEIRKKSNLTQVECAKRIGVGLRFLRELEQGKKSVRLDKLNQVLEFFGYHIEIKKDERE
ncbi:MAG: helix-turn-helix domain-containing protein [bacterium]